MEKQTFDNDETYLPCTNQQFQDLTNEILMKFNALIAPQALDANYFAQVVHGVIHAIDRKVAIVSKAALLEGCVNMVSKHVTYHAVEALQAAMAAQAAAAGGGNEAAILEDINEIQ